MPDVRHFDVDALLDAVVRLFWRQGMSSTGIQNLVAATGVSRSSLYATFGNKDGLYVAALRRYIERNSTPAFAWLASNPSGLPAIEDFFADLIQMRCSGHYAGWGCMVTNAHSGPECHDPEVRRVLDRHHQQLEKAMRSVLGTAAARGQVPRTLDLDSTAAVLAVVTYGINLRSRAGADPEALGATVAAVLDPLRTTPPHQP
ncbi:TetR/AcrR family transcriptional regulator [Streptomyces sp. 7N604]|uniref:TetR/AcrR family transcriptional regulator n=1 Tax=Streptomyces sp. 7N604 TaxID=3457415 RepID=UPI003FD6AEAB